MARVYVSKKIKFQFFVNIEKTFPFDHSVDSSALLIPALKAHTKSFKSTTSNGLVLFNQKFVDYIPKVSTRLRYIRSQKPVMFLHNSNPKEMDRRIHKVLVQIDSIMNLNISIVCGSCRKLKNDCNCQKSHYMIRCFVNLMGRSNGVPIKLCVRKIGVLFSLLNLSHNESLCVLGYLISYDKLTHSYKEFIKFTDIKYTGIIDLLFN